MVLGERLGLEVLLKPSVRLDVFMDGFFEDSASEDPSEEILSGELLPSDRLLFNLSTGAETPSPTFLLESTVTPPILLKNFLNPSKTILSPVTYKSQGFESFNPFKLLP
jgi:hypothetical protein